MQNRGITLPCVRACFGGLISVAGISELLAWNVERHWAGTYKSFFAGSSIDSIMCRLLSSYFREDSFFLTFLPFSAFVRGGTCSCYLQSLLPCEDVERDEAENDRRRIFTLSNWFAPSSSLSPKPTFHPRSIES